LLPAGDADFPPHECASSEGLLAIGGELSQGRLLAAYRQGIFPWYDESTPILWWSLPERCILPPAELHIPRSLTRSLHSGRYTVTLDRAFDEVIAACAVSPRPRQRGTWLTPDMRNAYTKLHVAGYAHSVEAWSGEELAGGLYGLAIGGVFFGESMFFRQPDASKSALVWLVRLLQFWGFALVDCQQTTANLLRFGARPVPRKEFLALLRRALALPGQPGTPWTMPEGFHPLRGASVGQRRGNGNIRHRPTDPAVCPAYPCSGTG
jgi:leucyl/phenylalanyl-tRNA--protein transferase